MSDQTVQTAYDKVPYNSVAFCQTHPDRLATIATFLGMDPAPVEHCRVLELGAASGGNLIPMAVTLPESEFIGLDLSLHQINGGQAAIKNLGLTNITLRHMNILDVTSELGQFDYIIAHGIYSWVPPQVQEKLLEICCQNLAPQGVAYISYNTYPGCHMQTMIRDMLLYHTQGIEEPAEQIAQAHAFLDFLCESVLGETTPHANFLQSYANYVRDRFLPKGDDTYLFHNELAEINEPLYFYQFMERATRHGLKYLAETQFQTILANKLPAKTAAALQKMAKDTIALEQYMDFLRNRTFRQTLLVHQELPLTSKLSPERLSRFYLASPAVPETPELDFRAGSIAKFLAPNGDSLATDHPVTKAAMLHLEEVWPQTVPFDTLLTEAYTRLNGSMPPTTEMRDDRQILGANLLKGFSYNEDLVEFHVYAPHFVKEVRDRPVASPVARFLAKNSMIITNMRHELVKLEGLSYSLLPFLDGSRDRPTLLDLLDEWQAKSILELHHATSREALAELLEAALRTLASAALLVE
jgi:methyltransferase-like protein/2-polyprenyl-3-methyl-5-hydroxy-6-metoxy-1,4-benzoquinol methylase